EMICLALEPLKLQIESLGKHAGGTNASHIFAMRPDSHYTAPPLAYPYTHPPTMHPGAPVSPFPHPTMSLADGYGEGGWGRKYNPRGAQRGRGSGLRRPAPYDRNRWAAR